MIIIMKKKLFIVISDRLQVADLFPVKLFLLFSTRRARSSDCSLRVSKFTNHKLFIVKFIEGEQKMNQAFDPQETDTP